jgi:hypothetical protein
MVIPMTSMLWLCDMALWNNTQESFHQLQRQNRALSFHIKPPFAIIHHEPRALIAQFSFGPHPLAYGWEGPPKYIGHLPNLRNVPITTHSPLYRSAGVGLECRSESSGPNVWPIQSQLIGKAPAFDCRNAPSAADAVRSHRNDQTGNRRRRTRR